MDLCKDCEFKGYSPQFCLAHIKHCQEHQRRHRKPLSPAVRVGAKTLAGAGIGVAAVVLGSTAVSLVGGAALIHAALFKLGVGASLTGGGIGFWKGLARRKSKPIQSRDKTIQHEPGDI